MKLVLARPRALRLQSVGDHARRDPRGPHSSLPLPHGGRRALCVVCNRARKRALLWPVAAARRELLHRRLVPTRPSILLRWGLPR